MAELAIWIVSFVAVGWMSILGAYAIGMILLLPVTGVAWVVEHMFPRVRLLLQPVGNVASRFRPATRAAFLVLPRSRAAIVIFVFVISCGAYLALRSREPSQADDRLSTIRTYNPATKALGATIRVYGPDGATYDFPDSTPEAEMNAAMAKVYPAPAGGQAPGASSSPGDPWAAFPVVPAPAGRR